MTPGQRGWETRRANAEAAAAAKSRTTHKARSKTRGQKGAETRKKNAALAERKITLWKKATEEANQSRLLYPGDSVVDRHGCSGVVVKVQLGFSPGMPGLVKVWQLPHDMEANYVTSEDNTIDYTYLDWRTTLRLVETRFEAVVE
jgi:hypothetical protein